MALFKCQTRDYMDGDTKYNHSVSTPQYQIKGEKPYIQELYYNKKVIDLLDNIKKSNVTEEEKKFLTIAAYRHYVFNYDKIAEYYACASKEMQRLMEESALVIIDIGDAIMNGYVIASKKIDSIIENNSRRSRDEE